MPSSACWDAHFPLFFSLPPKPSRMLFPTPSNNARKGKEENPTMQNRQQNGQRKGGATPQPPPLPPPFAGILGADTTALFRGGIWAEFVVFSLCRSHRWVNHGEKEPTVKKLVVGPARSWGRTADPNPPPGLAYPVIRVLGPT